MSGRREEGAEDAPRHGFRPTLAAGYLACLPLLFVYELGIFGGVPVERRNSAELVAGRIFQLFGDVEHLVRWSALALLALLAWSRLRREELSPGRCVLRQTGEGLLAAMALGPILLLLLSLFGISLEDLGPSVFGAERSPGLAAAGRLLGGAVWEEGLFRVGIYALIFLLVARCVRFFGLPSAAAPSLAELAALLGSSLAFAAFHLASVTRVLGVGGESFDERIFLWRLLAGLLLAGLLRWRGLGVAAWGHGLFNLALALGMGAGMLAPS